MVDPGAYRHLLTAQFRAQAQYRLSFCIDVLGSTVSTFMEVVVVLVYFRVAPSLGGFRLTEAFLMTALATLSFNLSDLMVGNVERLGRYVRTGVLDVLLVRPRGVLPQLLVTDFTTRRVGQVAQGLAVTVIGAAVAPVRWTPAHVLLLVLTPLVGAAFFAGLQVSGSTVAFYWIDSGEFSNAFTYGGRTFTNYPVSVYGGVFRRVFAYGFGFAFVAYYPALILLGRVDPLGAPRWLGWCGPLVAGVSVTVAALLWRTGVRHYRSTGS